ncbi:uncharacterized protein RCO7_14198 [Rhynchosporium graminicola]|uniref:Uncharacterized protein n=1 Tax=Rhynchosporium graminicola TaxID=2792576 RepID=A0A1E1JZ03_9HELO|nr:uncharacterized protein RCO7_14198 [Rhynchosporium commune]
MFRRGAKQGGGERCEPCADFEGNSSVLMKRHDERLMLSPPSLNVKSYALTAAELFNV